MSADEQTQLRAQMLANEASQANLVDPPQTDLIRWITPDEYGPVVSQCLRDAGFNAVGGGSSIWYPDGIGPAQRSAFDLATYVCDSKYTVNPKYNQVLTADQLGMVYDYDVQWLVPCIATFGITVSSPPTRDTFVSQTLQQSGLAWEPKAQAETSVVNYWSLDRQAQFESTCPTMPPVQYMFG